MRASRSTIASIIRWRISWRAAKRSSSRARRASSELSLAIAYLRGRRGGNERRGRAGERGGRARLRAGARVARRVARRATEQPGVPAHLLVLRLLLERLLLLELLEVLVKPHALLARRLLRRRPRRRRVALRLEVLGGLGPHELALALDGRELVGVLGVLERDLDLALAALLELAVVILLVARVLLRVHLAQHVLLLLDPERVAPALALLHAPLVRDLLDADGLDVGHVHAGV
jgi:hypothetical protein